MRHRTDIEIIMANALIRNNIKAIEQFPIRGKYGYCLDFAIPELKIDIEVDGEQYHKIGNSHDRKRNWALRNRDWKIIRFFGKEIKENVDKCVDKIKTIITEREVNSHGD